MAVPVAHDATVAPTFGGLLPSAVTATTPVGWEGGLGIDPEASAEAPTPVDAANVPAGGFDAPAEQAATSWAPFVVHAEVKRPTSEGHDPETLRAVASRRLVATTSHQLETALYAGATNTTNPYLTDGTTAKTIATGGLPVALTTGLALLEQFIAESLHGRRGMIHATPQTVTHWSTLGLLRREGEVLFTANGNIVVAGSGYTGASPNGAAAANGAVWAYATGIVEVRLSEALTAVNYDYDTNDIEAFARRNALVTLADVDAVAGVQLDLDPMTAA